MEPLKPRYDQLLTHLLPALVLFTFGLWWIMAPIFVYLRTKISIKPYKSMSSYPFPSTRGCSLESGYKIALGVMALIGETMVVIFTYHGIPTTANWVHLALIVLWTINGMTDAMTSRSVKIPKMTSYVTLIAFFISINAYLIYRNCSDIEAMLVNSTSALEWYNPDWTLPRGHLDIFLHAVLLAVVSFVVVILVLEMVCRNRVVISVARGVATVVTATWMVHVGFILEPPFDLPKWDQETVDYGLVLGYFAGHVAAAVVFSVAIFLLLYFKHKKANNWIMRIADPSEVERFIQ